MTAIILLLVGSFVGFVLGRLSGYALGLKDGEAHATDPLRAVEMDEPIPSTAFGAPMPSWQQRRPPRT
jgi:hypothetical protein